MCTGESAGLAGGVETLEDQGRAREAEAGVDRRDERQGGWEQLHLGEETCMSTVPGWTVSGWTVPG